MSVFVAMRKASLSMWGDAVIELATFSTIVHSEVWVLEEAQQKQLAYAAFDDADPCFTQRVAPTDSCDWVLLRIPVSVENVPLAHSFLQEIHNAKLRYRLPWECCCPQFVLHALENDLDCNRPDTWGERVLLPGDPAVPAAVCVRQSNHCAHRSPVRGRQQRGVARAVVQDSD